MTKPIPRRNFHWRAGRKPAGLSGVGPARVEPQEAATPQQDLTPRAQPQGLLKTSRMDAATAPQTIERPTRVRAIPTIPSVFANLPDNSKPQPRTRRQVKLPRQEAAGALVFARDASRHGC